MQPHKDSKTPPQLAKKTASARGGGTSEGGHKVLPRSPEHGYEDP